MGGTSCIHRLIISCIVFLTLLHLVVGQAATGRVTGTVTDESGAVIPGTEVLLTNEGTGAARRTLTNEEGFFSVATVPAGSYSLQVQLPGFAIWIRKKIAVRIGDAVNVPDIVLKVAGAADEVFVTAAPTTIAPTDSGEKAAIIAASEIENLAIVGRSAVELMKILPGVVYTSEGFPGETVDFSRGLGEYNVSGTRSTQVALLSDGADVIDPGCECGAAVTPNVDMVSEVKVSLASFGADAAKGPVVFQTVSKAGTSEFHGGAYLYFRDDRFNSQDWRANRFGTSKPDESYWFPGFNIGGPVVQDKLFFFAGVEFMGQRFTEGDVPAVVPTERQRRGDFTDVCSGELQLMGYNGCPSNDFWGNWQDQGFGGLENGIVDPGIWDPGGSALINLYPLPTHDPATNEGYNYISNIVKSQNRDQELVRVDWNVSDHTKLYTRFNHEFQRSNYPYTLWWTNDQAVPYPTNLRGDYETWSSSTSLTNVLSATTTNEVVVALTDWRMPHELDDPSKVSRSQIEYPYEGTFKNGIDMIPNLTGWSNGFATLMQAGGLINPTVSTNKSLISVEENFSKVLGTHTLKIGGRYAFISNDESTFDPDMGTFAFSSWGGNATGNGYADLLMGRATDYTESTINVVANIRRHEWAGYIQDSWKTTRRLTLDLGLRILHNGWNYDSHGRLAGFDADAYDPDAPIEEYSGLVAYYLGDDVPRSVWKTPVILFSPRVGFAFDLKGNGKTVLRGGGGVYHYHGRGGDSYVAVNNPPLAKDLYRDGGFFLGEPDTWAVQATRSSIDVLEPFEEAYPVTYSWSLTVSRRLPWDIFLEASYVGNQGSHQLSSYSGNIQEINFVPEGTLPPLATTQEVDAARPYHNFATINMIRHMLSQNYHSLQLMVNKQSGAFNFAASYTFSKAMGIGGGLGGSPINQVDRFDIRHRSYGPLSYDRTHSFSIAYNYMIPDLTNHRLWRHVVNGWQFTGISQFQSGAPIRQFARIEGTTSDGLRAGEGIDIAGTPHTSAQPHMICDPRENRMEGEYFNPRCWTAATRLDNGTYSFPYMKGPAFQNHDFSLFKNWQVGSDENHRLQFRISTYNLPNHPLPYFSGRELVLKFTDGELLPETIQEDNIGRTAFKKGRRILQFALKFVF